MKMVERSPHKLLVALEGNSSKNICKLGQFQIASSLSENYPLVLSNMDKTLAVFFVIIKTYNFVTVMETRQLRVSVRHHRQI